MPHNPVRLHGVTETTYTFTFVRRDPVMRHNCFWMYEWREPLEGDRLVANCLNLLYNRVPHKK
jgi:hypothetical protein